MSMRAIVESERSPGAPDEALDGEEAGGRHARLAPGRRFRCACGDGCVVPATELAVKECLGGLVGAPDEGAARHVGEAHAPAELGEALEARRVDVPGDG